MKKAKILILPLVAAATMLTACSEAPVNQGPELRGVSDISCLVNTSVDLLDGVSALDLEDGDITPDLKITVTPETEVIDGYAVFPETGEYEVCYEIRDSLGKLARTTAYATVIEREVYMANVLTNGFSLNTQGGVKVLSDGLNGSAYAFKVTGGEIAEDVKLSATYTLVCGAEYSFSYYFVSNLTGRIKIAADGAAFTERNISAGENVTEFTYSLPYSETADGEVASETVEIELWLGALTGELQFEFYKSETQRLQEAGGSANTDVIENFNFTGKVAERFDGADGAVEVAANGKSASIEIIGAGDEIWQGGMFIKTGLSLEPCESYIIEFDAVSKENTPFEAVIKREQWGDSSAELAILKNPDANGSNSVTIDLNKRTQGELWIYIQLGTAEGKVTISNLKVKKAGYTDKLNVTFGNNIEGRFDKTKGNIGITDDGKGAFVDITEAGDGIWRGGIFVNTGMRIAAYETYLIEFDTVSENDTPFEVVAKREQWGDDSAVLGTLYTPERKGHNKLEVSSDGNQGRLWLYLQCGNHVGKVTISNLTVKLKERGLRKEIFSINEASVNHNNGGEGALSVENGKIIYRAESFGHDWGNNEIGTPSFALAGAAETFVVTFKAKASQNINCVFAGTVNDLWETFVWKQLNIRTEEQTYSVKCDKKSLDDIYRFVWQFGCADNAAYRDVTIEISDLKICYLSDLEK